MKKRTSKEIFASSLLALARQEAVERITVKQIVENSGLSLQTFYNHFHDKEDLILWIHRSEGERMLKRLAGKNYRFHDLVMDNVHFYTENANYLRDSLGSGSLSRFALATAESAFSALRTYILRRSGMEELPAELALYLKMYIYACLHVFAERDSGGLDLSDEHLAQYLEDGMPEKLKPLLID